MQTKYYNLNKVGSNLFSAAGGTGAAGDGAGGAADAEIEFNICEAYPPGDSSAVAGCTAGNMAAASAGAVNSSARRGAEAVVEPMAAELSGAADGAESLSAVSTAAGGCAAVAVPMDTVDAGGCGGAGAGAVAETVVAMAAVDAAAGGDAGGGGAGAGAVAETVVAMAAVDAAGGGDAGGGGGGAGAEAAALMAVPMSVLTAEAVAPAAAVAVRTSLPRATTAATAAVRSQKLHEEAQFYAEARREAEAVLSEADTVVFEATQLAWVVNTMLKLFNEGSSKTTLVALLQQTLENVQRQKVKKKQVLEGAQRRLAQYSDPRHSWLRRCYDIGMGSIRNQAFLTLRHNILTNAAKCKKNGGRPFRLHFMTRKKKHTSFAVSWDHWSCERGFWARLRDRKQCRAARYKPPVKMAAGNSKKTRQLPDNNSPAAAHHGVRLLQTRDGQFFVLLRFEVKSCKVTESQGTLRVCSLDPGVRRVLTVYDVTNGRLIKLGDNAIAVLEKLLRQRDELALRSRADLEQCAPAVVQAQGIKNHTQRYHMKQALARLDLHITNMVNALQCDMAKWLCDNFDLILLPKFGTQQMIRRCGRKINKRTARNLQMLAFHRFEKRLEEMAEQRGRKVDICSEAWTSKTCCRCGHINRRLGGSVLFCCENCSFTADRDMVGAVNVFLRYATKFKLRQQQQQQQQQQQAQASKRKHGDNQFVLEPSSGQPPIPKGSRPS